MHTRRGGNASSGKDSSQSLYTSTSQTGSLAYTHTHTGMTTSEIRTSVQSPSADAKS